MITAISPLAVNLDETPSHLQLVDFKTAYIPLETFCKNQVLNKLDTNCDAKEASVGKSQVQESHSNHITIKKPPQMLQLQSL